MARQMPVRFAVGTLDVRAIPVFRKIRVTNIL